MSEIVKATYWAKIKYLDKYFVNKLLENRKKIYKIFLNKIKPTEHMKIVDIGTTPSVEPHENYLIHAYPWKKNITCISNVDCSIIKSKYPEINIIIADGRKTELPDKKFDLVYSNAVIEHVGSYSNQTNFIKECVRLSKNKVFITTPNRYFPLDFHTKIPLIHMLPKKIHRKILHLIGDNFFKYENNLNLLSRKDLINICKNLHINKYSIETNKLLMINSNYMLVIENNY